MTERPVTVSPKRIVVVDDHEMVREALVGLLRCRPDVDVCGEAGSVEQGLAIVAEQKPDLVLVDLVLRGRDGLDLVRQLYARDPGVVILIITMKDAGAFARKASAAGARGYLMKDRLTDDLHPAIDAVCSGGTWFGGHLP